MAIESQPFPGPYRISSDLPVVHLAARKEPDPEKKHSHFPWKGVLGVAFLMFLAREQISTMFSNVTEYVTQNRFIVAHAYSCEAGQIPPDCDVLSNVLVVFRDGQSRYIGETTVRKVFWWNTGLAILPKTDKNGQPFDDEIVAGGLPGYPDHSVVEERGNDPMKTYKPKVTVFEFSGAETHIDSHTLGTISIDVGSTTMTFGPGQEQ